MGKEGGRGRTKERGIKKKDAKEEEVRKKAWMRKARRK